LFHIHSCHPGYPLIAGFMQVLLAKTRSY
jgi:hypothetical protein